MERRNILAGLAAMSAGSGLLAGKASAQQALTPQPGPSSTAPNARMSVSNVTSEKQYRAALMGPATLSLATSQIAMGKASNEWLKLFATFEYNEMNAITFVLRDLGTPTLPMAQRAQEVLEQNRSTPAGPAFDRAYLANQIETHEMLRDLHTAYLANTTGQPSRPMELHGRHIATIALATINEHLTLARRISGEMRA